jgi:hypothetical protein
MSQIGLFFQQTDLEILPDISNSDEEQRAQWRRAVQSLLTFVFVIETVAAVAGGCNLPGIFFVEKFCFLNCIGIDGL